MAVVAVVRLVVVGLVVAVIGLVVAIVRLVVAVVGLVIAIVWIVVVVVVAEEGRLLDHTGLPRLRLGNAARACNRGCLGGGRDEAKGNHAKARRQNVLHHHATSPFC